MANLQHINKQRELMDYDFHHLYNRVKFGAGSSIEPRAQCVGDDTAEYVVLIVGEDGRRKRWKFSSYERCVQVAEQKGGMVLRLGRNSRSLQGHLRNLRKSHNQRSPTTGAYVGKLNVIIDESGNMEPIPIALPPDVPSDHTISEDLEVMGYSRAIQYNSTRPPSQDLFRLHQRHGNVSMEDFAAAVVKHFEPVETPKAFVEVRSRLSRTPAEKEAWYSTSAGQQWLKNYSVPSIMNHTKRELLGWKNPERSVL